MVWLREWLSLPIGGIRYLFDYWRCDVGSHRQFLVIDFVEIIKYKLKDYYGRVKDTDFLKKGDVEGLRKLIEEFDYSKGLENGDKVSFMSNVTYPRRSFSKSYPENKLVSSDADCYVVDKLKLLSNLSSYVVKYKLIEEGVIAVDYSNGTIELCNYINVGLAAIAYNIFTSGKKVIDVYDISVKSDGSMNDKRSFDFILALLRNRDIEKKRLAVIMMSDYDYSLSNKYIAIALKLSHWEGWWKRIAKTVKLTHLAKMINTDYKMLSAEYQFMISMMVEHSDDKVMQEIFSDWIGTVVKTDKRFILSEYVDIQPEQSTSY